MIAAGSIILVDFPRSDGAAKLRPALVLCVLPRFGDLLLCGLSTQLHQAIVGVDVLLEEGSPGFGPTGLLRTSLVRLTMLARIGSEDPRIAGTLGRVDQAALQLMRQRLAGIITSGGG